MSQFSTWRSLRVKIVAWSFIPTLIILSAVAVIIFVAYNQVTSDLVVERNRELTRLTASQLSSSLNEYGQALSAAARALAQLPGADDYADGLAVWRTRLVMFDGGVVALDAQGRVAAAVPTRPDVVGEDWSGRGYFGLLQSGGSMIVSNVVYDGPVDAPVIVVTVPITGAEGELLGGLAGMFLVGRNNSGVLYEKIAKLRAGQTSSAYLVDGNRRLIFESDGEADGLVGENDIVDAVLAGKVATQRTRDADGTWVLASFAPVPDTDWGLVSQESWAELIRSGQEYGRFLLALLALGVVIPLGVVIVGVRRITAPLWGLIHAAQDVARGNFEHTIHTGTHDEIAELAGQFNVMASRLRSSYAELEQRVADRTRELATLNAISGVVSRSLELQEILRDALDKTLEVFNLQAGGIHLVDEEGGDLRLAVSSGVDAGWLEETGSLERFEDLPEQMVRIGQPYATGDLATDSGVIHEFLAATGYASLVSMTLRSKGQVRGVLFGLSLQPRTFDAAELELLTSIGDQIGVGVDNARLFAAESRRRQEASVLAGMARLISSTLDLDQVLRLTVEYAVDIFKADHCLMYLYDRAAGPLRCVVEAGVEGGNGTQLRRREMTPVPEVVQSVLETLRPLVLGGDEVGPELGALGWADQDVQSILLVPIEVRGRRLGLLQLATRRPARGRFSADEADLALAMANQAAMAIDNARYYRDQQRRAEQFRIINEVSGRISSVLDTDDLLETVVQQIKDTFDYYNVNVFMVDPAGEELVLKAGLRGEGDQEMMEEHRLRIGSEGILGHVAADGRAVLVNDVSQDSRYRALAGLPDTRSELGVPIKVRGQLIGVLDVQSRELHGFDRGDLITLQTLADQIGHRHGERPAVCRRRAGRHRGGATAAGPRPPRCRHPDALFGDAHRRGAASHLGPFAGAGPGEAGGAAPVDPRRSGRDAHAAPGAAAGGAGGGAPARTVAATLRGHYRALTGAGVPGDSRRVRMRGAVGRQSGLLSHRPGGAQ